MRDPPRRDASRGLQLGLETLAARLKRLSRILLEHLGRLIRRVRSKKVSESVRDVNIVRLIAQLGMGICAGSHLPGGPTSWAVLGLLLQQSDELVELAHLRGDGHVGLQLGVALRAAPQL